MKKAVTKKNKENSPFNSNLVYQVAVSQLSNRRKSIAHTKTRGEVSGGGKKPWRQKGTGRARHGSSRSPIWVGGGVTFGPRNEINFKRTIPKKIRRKALLEIIEEKEKTNNIVIVPEIKVTKTKEAKEFLIKSSISESALIVLNQLDKLTILAFRNIPKTKTIQAKDLNCLDVLTFKKIVLTKDCLEEIKKSINK
ncbi:MAG: 50S ribosomal protein L4 [Candidatus Microsyncoccus archaeolyticus]|jgi:large subunit ribosomal protein L4|nr:MAG: 50S ribosomal protein L4 [Candidatus Parcubacteria bacterium]